MPSHTHVSLPLIFQVAGPAACRPAFCGVSAPGGSARHPKVCRVSHGSGERQATASRVSHGSDNSSPTPCRAPHGFGERYPTGYRMPYSTGHEHPTKGGGPGTCPAAGPTGAKGLARRAGPPAIPAVALQPVYSVRRHGYRCRPHRTTTGTTRSCGPPCAR